MTSANEILTQDLILVRHVLGSRSRVRRSQGFEIGGFCPSLSHKHNRPHYCPISGDKSPATVSPSFQETQLSRAREKFGEKVPQRVRASLSEHSPLIHVTIWESFSSNCAFSYQSLSLSPQKARKYLSELHCVNFEWTVVWLFCFVKVCFLALSYTVCCIVQQQSLPTGWNIHLNQENAPRRKAAPAIVVFLSLHYWEVVVWIVHSCKSPLLDYIGLHVRAFKTTLDYIWLHVPSWTTFDYVFIVGLSLTTCAWLLLDFVGGN